MRAMLPARCCGLPLLLNRKEHRLRAKCQFQTRFIHNKNGARYNLPITLTLDIPDTLDAAQRERRAVALYDARLVTPGQAAQMAGLSRPDFIQALIRAGVSVIQYNSAGKTLANAGLPVP